MPPITSSQTSRKLGLALETTSEEALHIGLLNTQSRGCWGQSRALLNLRKVDILAAHATSIKLSWDPLPRKPFRTCSYMICMQEVGVTGYLPVVDDTGRCIEEYCGVGLKPDTLYRFQVTCLCQSPVDSKYAGARLAIPKSSVRSVAVRTLPARYDQAWFMEEEKIATRVWRCYTGEAWCSSSARDFSKAVDTFVSVSHSDKLCYSGIRCVKIEFPGVDAGDFTMGGTATDCEIAEDKLWIFRARVYHEWQPESYFREHKVILRVPEKEDGAVATFEEQMKTYYNNVDSVIMVMYDELKAARMGATDEDGGTVVECVLGMPSGKDEPVVVTITKKYTTVRPTAFARLCVWDKIKTVNWSEEEKDVPLNEWHTIEITMIGGRSGKGKIFMHVGEGFQGSVYLDNVEVIWGGPTPTEKAITRAIESCEKTHQEHSESMRVGLLDGRDLQAVDWGGASDPYATVFLNEGESGRIRTTEVLKSSVVMADLYPVWNCDPIKLAKPPALPVISAIDKEEAAKVSTRPWSPSMVPTDGPELRRRCEPCCCASAQFCHPPSHSLPRLTPPSLLRTAPPMRTRTRLVGPWLTRRLNLRSFGRRGRALWRRIGLRARNGRSSSTTSRARRGVRRRRRTRRIRTSSI